MDNPKEKKVTAIQKITLPNGLQVGITGLDLIITEVAALNLADDGLIQKKLLEKVKVENYVAAGAEQEYASALLKAYRRKTGTSEERYEIETKKHHAG